MTNLPVHPHTALTALGLRRDGRPIYPVKGGSVDTAPPGAPVATPPAASDPATPPPPTAPLTATPAAGTGTPAPPDDKPLGPAGERALAAEREERKALAKQLADLAPLKKLADALGAGTPAAQGKSEIELLNERFAEHEKQLGEERTGRFRAEVASAKGLTAEQAARLNGSTREELEADADALLALFPAAPAGPRTPAPDPTQGARTGQPGGDLESQITEAQNAGDVRRVIQLQKQKLTK